MYGLREFYFAGKKNLSVIVKLTNHLKLFLKLCSFSDNPLSNTSDLSTSSVSRDQSLCAFDTESVGTDDSTVLYASGMLF